MTDSKPVYAVSGFTLNLTTNSKLLKTNARVGYPQLALTFTNKVIKRTPLFMHRNAAGDVPRFPLVETFLVAKVGEYSRKFEGYLQADVEKDPDLAKAVRAHEAAIDKLRDVERLCHEHFEAIEGCKELGAKIDAQEKRLRRWRESNPKGNLDEDIREADTALREMYKERIELMKANPAPVDQSEMVRLRNAEERAKEAVEATWNYLLHGTKNRGRVLQEYLGLQHVKLTQLPDPLKNAVASGSMELYEIEPDNAPIPTDLRGIPSARLPGSKRTCVCDREVAMPWRHVMTALKSANLNRLYPSGGRERFFVYAQIDASRPPSADTAKTVDTIVIGTFRQGKNDVGWALILQNKQWAQVIRNIDVVRGSGILEQLLPFWPDESHEKLSTEARPTTEDEDREESAEANDASGQEPEARSEAPADTAEEPAPSAASVN